MFEESDTTQPTIIGRQKMKADQESEASNVGTAHLLTPGSTYKGSVLGRNEEGSYQIQLTATARILGDVEYATGIFAGMLGYQTHAILTPGTDVMVVYGPPSYIVACLPSSDADDLNGHSRALLGGEAFNDVSDGGGIPMDLLEGEVEVANNIGVGLDLLTFISRLRAGDRAKIECHLIEDMVSIISSQFRHLDSLGEKVSYHNGRSNEEVNRSSYMHELMGVDKGQPILELDGDDLADSTERIKDLGRWRYTEYTGFVGDFIHKFITDPVSTAVNAHAEKARSGKSWIHEHSDGSILMQSTAEIALERVVRIPVPNRKTPHNDPKLKTDVESLNKDYLKIWDYGKPDGTEIYRTAYQLREYARWLSRYNAFARFSQQSDEFHVPAETDGEDPSWTSKEADREATNPRSLDYYEAYSTIRILRDGSTVIHDGYGSSVVMANGNVQVSASRHLELEAAGDIRVVAGGSILMKAKRNFEMVATVGGFIAKSRTLWRALCEKGTLYLRSDADDPDHPDYEPYTPEEGDPEAVVESQAVMVEAVNGQAGITAKQRVQALSTGSTYSDDSGDADDAHNTSASVVMDSRSGGVKLRATKDLLLVSSESVGIKSSKHMVVTTPRWYNDVGEFEVSRKFLVRHGQLYTQGIIASRVEAKDTLAGPKMGYTGALSTERVPQHYNHVRIVNGDLEIKKGEDADAINKLQEVSNASTAFNDVWEGKYPMFGFYDESEYYWDTSEDVDGVLIETITQQHLRVDLPEYWGESHNYATWNWGSEQLLSSTRIDNADSFGNKGSITRHNGGDNLHQASNKSSTAYSTSATSWETTNNITFKILKRE